MKCLASKTEARIFSKNVLKTVSIGIQRLAASDTAPKTPQDAPKASNKAAKKVQDASQRPRERPPKASRCLLAAPRKAMSKLIGSLMFITAICSYCKC